MVRLTIKEIIKKFKFKLEYEEQLEIFLDADCKIIYECKEKNEKERENIAVIQNHLQKKKCLE